MNDPINESKLNILTDEEIVRMAGEGSSTAYEYLLLKYKYLVKSISRKYYIVGADAEDVIQEGTIGLFKAIRDYDIDAGGSFKSFASLCIERQIQTAVNGANREKHRILNESIPLLLEEGIWDESEDGSFFSFENIPADLSSDPEGLALMRETLQYAIIKAKKRLTALEVKVFEGMLRGESYRDMADSLGLSSKTVDNAIQRVKKKIQI